MKVPYNRWETFKNGMYKTLSEIDNYDVLYNNAKTLLSNQVHFYNAGIEMVNAWTISCNNFLTNIHINKLAFIGQASCCYKYNVPEIITKEVWKNLDINTQNEANKTAKKIIKHYETKRSRLHAKMAELWL